MRTSLFLILILNVACIQHQLSELDSLISEIVWCGNNKEIAITLTETNSVYKSTDKGFSWIKLNDFLITKGREELNELRESKIEIGKVYRIMVSPVDLNLVIFLGTHGINWISENCGEKVMVIINQGSKLQDIIFHPFERKWYMATAYTTCEDLKNEPCRVTKKLFVTQDLGKTWKILEHYVIQAGWGALTKEIMEAGVPKERILMTYQPKGKDTQIEHGWNYKIDFVYSDDFFNSIKVRAHKGNKFLLTKHYLYVAQLVDQEEQEVTLLVAKSQDKHLHFKPIELLMNNKKFKEHSYTFLDTSDNSVFLHVNHFGEKSQYGHIYISDPEGLTFSLNLMFNAHSSDGQCEFGKVISMAGIYISNNIDAFFMNDNLQKMEEKLIEEAFGIEENIHVRNKEVNSDVNYKNFLQTFITFNKGGKWNFIRAPLRDSDGKLFDCGDHCHLNLFGSSSDYPSFYSVESAVGLVISNGNVGKYLSSNKEDVHTFLSRDGGYTWFEVRKGPHIYEIGDQGGLIVMSEYNMPTNKIIYSWDEGMTWQDFEISPEDIYIKNIIIETHSNSQHFLIYGLSSIHKGKKLGVTIGLDFSSIKPQCRNSDNPNTPNSDYEIWSLSDESSDNICLMGVRTTYVRRKRQAECFNGNQYKKKVIIDSCPCTKEDYECDYGYKRSDSSEPCLPENQIINNDQHSLCVDYYKISKGYRKIYGNACVGGTNFDPLFVPCPHSNTFSGLAIILFVLMFILLIYLIFIAFSKKDSNANGNKQKMSYNDKQLNFIEEDNKPLI